jgi:hypothetical protein
MSAAGDVEPLIFLFSESLDDSSSNTVDDRELHRRINPNTNVRRRT